jgi:hypothetical protein
MHRRGAAGAFGLGCVGLMMLGMIGPAAASMDDRAPASRDDRGGRMGAQDVGADCEQAIMDMPDRRGGLKVTTEVPEGAEVAPGQDIRVKLTWDPKDWSGEDLDAALACVQVKGGLDSDLSRGERPTANDGVVEFTLHVPENIRPGCDICVQGFLTGAAPDGGPQQVGSDRACFMSGPPRPPSPPVTRPPTPPATDTATPPATAAATPGIPTEVGGITASKPAPAPLQTAPAAPAAAPAGELPRTGSPMINLASAGGGLSLTLGGLSVIGAAGRRRRRA